MMTGDGAVGKTCMLIRYGTGEFPGEYLPTVFDNHSMAITAPDGMAINLGLWDIAGGEDYDRLRPFSYPGTDVHVVCFSIISPASFASVEEKWFPELETFYGRGVAVCAGIEYEVTKPKMLTPWRAPSRGGPVVLVGNMLDLRSDALTLALLEKKGLSPISSEQGATLAQKLGAVAYRECSALTGEGIKDVYDTAVQAAQRAAITKANGRKRGKCIVM